MRILITGCCGFIGSHLTETLLTSQGKDIDVMGVDNINDYYEPRIKHENLDRLRKHSRFSFLHEDMVTSRCIATWKPDVVYHLASMAGVRNSLLCPAEYVRHNIEAFVNVLQQAVEASVQKVFYASSSSVYGNSTQLPYSESHQVSVCKSPYAASKLAMEMFAKTYNDLYNLTCVGFRFFTVYGPRGRPDMAPYKFLKAIHYGHTIQRYGNGTSSRDYTYVSDIVDGLIRAQVVPPGTCEVFNLGQSRPVTLLEFISTCERVVGKKAVVCEIENQPGDVNHTYANTEKAHDSFGFESHVTLEEGLTWMYASYRGEWGEATESSLHEASK